MLYWILIVGGLLIMMGQHDRSEALFYYFRLEDQVPETHLLRLIEKHISFAFVREKLMNDNHNKDLKNLFKSAAISASTRPGPLQDFYVALVGKGIRPTMARLTLARKIAAITLTMWKKGVSFDPKQLHRQAKRTPI